MKMASVNLCLTCVELSKVCKGKEKIVECVFWKLHNMASFTIP